MRTIRFLGRSLALATALALPARAIGGDTSLPKPSADPVLERILKLGREDNRVQEHTRTLCKTFGHRLTGTEGYDKAARWAVEQFQSYGLNARLETWGEFPMRFERGYSTGGMVEPIEIDYTFITPAWSPGTGGRKRGPAILEPTTEEGLEAVRSRLAGAWIVNAEPAPPGDLRRKLREACVEAKAHGFIRPGGRSERLLMGGNHQVEEGKIPEQASIQLLRSQYDALRSRLEKAEEPVVLEFDVRNKLIPGPVACTNVVADLVGVEKPDEFVIVGGHLDAWDAAEGAQDNATGCATALEAARLIASAGGRPRRTIRFLLFGGEEQGLFGSRGYVEAHEDELEKTSIALIHDGGGTVLSGLDTTYAMLDDFEKVFAPLSTGELEGDAERFPFRIGESDGLLNTGDSDHAPFLQAGVPGFFWNQSGEGYSRIHHTHFDVFETIDPAQQERSAIVVAVGAYGFAQLDHLLDRTDSKAVEPRRMGVSLEGLRVTRVSGRGKAKGAGWQEGDVILSIDGREPKDRDEVTEIVRSGGGKKTFRLKRAEEIVESTIDWGDEGSEKERGERAARREAWLRARASSATK
ncbi:MAG: M20/M25/M40 family metallo-hydrolase [Planctomycetota bacterium]